MRNSTRQGLPQCCISERLLYMQTSAALQVKLRRGQFNLVDRPSRMLPRIFNPVQLNVDCSAKTPGKAPEAKKPKRGRPAKGKASKDAADGTSNAAAAGHCHTSCLHSYCCRPLCHDDALARVACAMHGCVFNMAAKSEPCCTMTST